MVFCAYQAKPHILTKYMLCQWIAIAHSGGWPMSMVVWGNSNLICDAFDKSLRNRLERFGEVMEDMAKLTEAEVVIVRSRTKSTKDLISPIVKRYRAKFRLFWIRGNSAFANPYVYKYCEGEKVIYFIRLPSNGILRSCVGPRYAVRWAGPRSPASRSTCSLFAIRPRVGTSPGGWFARWSGTAANCFRGWAKS